MKTALSLSTVTVVLLMGALPVLADIARPKPSPESKIILHTSLQIVPDAKTYEARLQISADTLKYLRTALNEVPANLLNITKYFYSFFPNLSCQFC